MNTAATDAVEALGIDHRVSAIGRVSSAEEAASERGIALECLVKTLVVRRADDDYVFVLIPGHRALDWPKLRSELGVSRLSLPPADEARSVTGYERGTITPFGSTRPWPVVADRRLAGHSELVIGGGAHGIGIHLSSDALLYAVDARLADVTKAGNATAS